jgi:hypothetical protein
VEYPIPGAPSIPFFIALAKQTIKITCISQVIFMVGLPRAVNRLSVDGLSEPFQFFARFFNISLRGCLTKAVSSWFFGRTYKNQVFSRH